MDKLLPGLLCGYTTNNVFNADEMALRLDTFGLFFKDKRKNHGDFGLLVGGNMDGSEKLPLLVIAASPEPESGEDCTMDSSIIQYVKVKSTRTTHTLLKEYLMKWDTVLQQAKRKVLLFLDNAASHQELQEYLQNVKIVNFVANMTELLQPMDRGPIFLIRFFFMSAVERHIQEKLNIGEGEKEVELSCVVKWLEKIWGENITPHMISTAFEYAGFVKALEMSKSETSNSQGPLGYFEDIRKYCGKSSLPQKSLDEHNSLGIELRARMKKIVENVKEQLKREKNHEIPLSGASSFLASVLIPEGNPRTMRDLANKLREHPLSLAKWERAVNIFYIRSRLQPSPSPKPKLHQTPTTSKPKT